MVQGLYQIYRTDTGRDFSLYFAYELLMNFRSYISIKTISKYIKICKPTYFQHSTCKVPQQHKVPNDQSLVCSIDIMACIGNTCASHVVVVMKARRTRGKRVSP